MLFQELPTINLLVTNMTQSGARARTNISTIHATGTKDPYIFQFSDYNILNFLIVAGDVRINICLAGSETVYFISQFKYVTTYTCPFLSL